MRGDRLPRCVETMLITLFGIMVNLVGELMGELMGEILHFRWDNKTLLVFCTEGQRFAGIE